MHIHIDDLKDLRVGTLVACLVVSLVWHSGERLVNLIPGHHAESKQASSSADFGTSDIYPNQGGIRGVDGGYLTTSGDNGGFVTTSGRKTPEEKRSSLDVRPASYNPGYYVTDSYNPGSYEIRSYTPGTYVSAPPKS
jgi:hypothetical protein